MKTFKIKTSGTLHTIISNDILRFNGEPATKDNITILENDLNFIICDLKLAHGNINKDSRSACLSPVNNDGSFNVVISW